MSTEESLFEFKELDEQGLSRCLSDCPRITCKRKTSSNPGLDLWEGDKDDCLFFVLHDTISNEKHIFRGNGRRHNKHAGQRPKAPDLMVKRHIRGGLDVND